MSIPCKICSHPQRREIEEDMKNMPQAAIVKKWNVYHQNITNHKSHLNYDIKERLQELIQESLKSKVPPESIGDLARLLSEYRAFSLLEDKCTECPHRRKNERTIEDALKEYLEDDSDEIYITVEQYALFTEWLKTLPEDNELRKKYDLFELKIGAHNLSNTPKVAAQVICEAPVKVNEVFIPEKHVERRKMWIPGFK